MLDFLKKVDLVMKNVDLYLKLEMWIFKHHFLKKSGRLSQKCGPLSMIFLKKVDLDLKKSGPRPKKWTIYS